MKKEVVGSYEILITAKLHIFRRHKTVICILPWEMNLISHTFPILSLIDVVSKLTASLLYLTTLAG